MPRTAAKRFTGGKRPLSPTRRKESEVQQPERKARRSSDKRLNVNVVEPVRPQPDQSIRNREAGPQNQHRKWRYRPGKLALREIRKYQNSFGFLIPKMPFSRVVREISLDAGLEVTRWEARALEALQEAAEAFLVHLLEDSYICALHAKRSTLMVRDMRLARRIGGHPF